MGRQGWFRAVRVYEVWGLMVQCFGALGFMVRGSRLRGWDVASSSPGATEFRMERSR